MTKAKITHFHCLYQVALFNLVTEISNKKIFVKLSDDVKINIHRCSENKLYKLVVLFIPDLQIYPIYQNHNKEVISKSIVIYPRKYCSILTVGVTLFQDGYFMFIGMYF